MPDVAEGRSYLWHDKYYPPYTSVLGRQATVAQRVMLRPIFEVCAGDKGCEGGGRRMKDW